MKAVILQAYGPPEMLAVQEIPKPSVGPGDVLIRVRATTVNFGDLMARRFSEITSSEFHMPGPLFFFAKLAFGWRTPRVKVLGSEFAGEVEAVGGSVTQWKPGDRVFGYTGARMGCYADYLLIPEDGAMAGQPTNVSPEETASSIYGAVMALGLLKKAGVQRGERVLVNGASGSIGTAALQLCKHAGAHVTGVCGTSRVDYVRSLGADRVMDYTREDFTKGNERYDLIIDVLGKTTPEACAPVLTPKGRCLYVSFKMKHVWSMLRSSRKDGQRVICSLASESAEAVREVGRLLESGALRARIGRKFPLEQAAEAHRYAGSGERSGPIVLTVGG